jgi:DNA-binding PadR family transcriptional regulator
MTQRNRQRVELPTRSEIAVMQILQTAAAGLYGLELVEASNGEVSRGSVYVLLGRLEDKGFVKKSEPAKAATDHPGLPRPIYKLTAEGMRVLAVVEGIGLVTGV